MAKTNKCFAYFQPNKKDKEDKYDDCVTRAFCKALDKEWLAVFDEMHPLSRELQMPASQKQCYQLYLAQNNFKYNPVSNAKGTKRPTVASFAQSHKSGTYVVVLANHLCCVKDGKYYDTWDCGAKCLYGYWQKSEIPC